MMHKIVFWLSQDIRALLGWAIYHPAHKAQYIMCDVAVFAWLLVVKYSSTDDALVLTGEKKAKE